jgi:hypothetical protein
MANRFPLIVDSDTSTVKELPSGDNLSLVGNNILMGDNTITDAKILQWDSAYGWGDHSLAGYQSFDSDTAKTDIAQTFTAAQRSTVTNDSDGSFDLNASNDFTCTPTGSITIGFTNETAGQSGNILLVNTTPQVISVGADVFIAEGDLTTINAAGTYLMSYYCPDGTNVYLSTTPALTEGA